MLPTAKDNFTSRDTSQDVCGFMDKFEDNFTIPDSVCQEVFEPLNPRVKILIPIKFPVFLMSLDSICFDVSIFEFYRWVEVGGALP